MSARSGKTAPSAAAPVSVRVDLGARGYEIAIGGGLLAEAGTRIARLKPKAKAAIVTDETVAALYLDPCRHALSAAGIESTPIVIRPGEGSKNFPTYERVVDALLQAKIERGDLMIALGGGVVGDLAGFAAATVHRGIGLVQIPTTLLAQVDSSVGGKTGIDTARGKNLVGAFHQPLLVIADTDLLDSLSPREFRSGYAEVAKYGLINDEPFFAWLEKNWKNVFAGGPDRVQAVAASCRAKAAVVGRDEREAGERALLNLGHTFGHALEAAAGYSERLLHGEAIAIGIVLAFRLSHRLGRCPRQDAERVAAHFSAVDLPTKLSEVAGGLPDSEALIALMAQDKKVRGGSLVFVLARGIGRTEIAEGIDIRAVRETLDEGRRNS
ncbi:MAG TPA: 3-dehydroquinate synthase [Xanthobacteraceae bacterium]|nr:3-dehydroquinate synthase [Xanthobacteraceae bacterium]